MTNKEAIKIVKVAQAEVEWEYPLDYAVAFDLAIKALETSVEFKLDELTHALHKRFKKYKWIHSKKRGL